jgi:hypothetical protein
LKGKKIPPTVYHTHKVVPRSRPNAKEQLGRRRWDPSRRYGRLIRHEDYDAYAAHELDQTARLLNNESLLDLSIKGGRAAKGMIERVIGGGKLWGRPGVRMGESGEPREAGFVVVDMVFS